jgi:hypothetical protein
MASFSFYFVLFQLEDIFVEFNVCVIRPLMTIRIRVGSRHHLGCGKRQLNGTVFRMRLEIQRSPCCIYSGKNRFSSSLGLWQEATKWGGGVLQMRPEKPRWDRKKCGPLLQQVWHEKEPSLLRGPVVYMYAPLNNFSFTRRLFVLSGTSNFSAIWRLSPLTLIGLPI